MKALLHTFLKPEALHFESKDQMASLEIKDIAIPG